MSGTARSLTGAVQHHVTGVLNKGQSFVDARFPQQKRADLWAKASAFASEKPLLASFLVAHLALSGVPIALFLMATTTVIISSLVTAVILALLGALTFIACAVGTFLIFLLPTLFVTTFLGSCIWVWGLGAYYTVTWIQQKRGVIRAPDLTAAIRAKKEKIARAESGNGWGGEAKGLPLPEKESWVKGRTVLNNASNEAFVTNPRVPDADVANVA